MSNRTAAEYRRLPYRRRVDKRSGEDHFVAYVQEIPWIRAHAEDPVSALALLDGIFDDAIEAMIEAGDEVPKPPGTFEAFGVADALAGVSVPLPLVKATATLQPIALVVFAEEEEMEPWRDAEIAGEKLVPAGTS